MDGTMVQNLDVLNVPSRRRNPVIADIFNRLRYMDRRGSGFKKIVEDYQMYANVSNGAKPVFRSELRRLPMRSVRTGKMHLRRLLKLRIIGC